MVIDHPTREATLAVVLMLSGGPAQVLAARVWYQWLVVGAAPRAQLLTIAALAAAAAAAQTAPALLAALAVVAIRATLVVVEHREGVDQHSNSG